MNFLSDEYARAEDMGVPLPRRAVLIPRFNQRAGTQDGQSCELKHKIYLVDINGRKTRPAGAGFRAQQVTVPAAAGTAVLDSVGYSAARWSERAASMVAWPSTRLPW
ncbi:hypothetical protein GCM10007170_28920 [Arthrobacter liuii]|uniref:Uncharacterized protein n=1 Tax=Arthrobacter liuii TaxID=1476996 RepID=A0ABQ2AWV7_9MICC|nr:hypothetical protein GCM10007170_28920 [Arthrobacter liuii]